jgi:hypothetical protein
MIRFKVSNAVVALAAAVVGGVAILGSGSYGLLLLALGYVGACMAITRWMLSGAESRRSAREIEFCGKHALRALGDECGSFLHVFRSDKPVLGKYKDAMTAALAAQLGCPPPEVMSFKDIDRDLERPETRTLLRATAPATVRGNGLSLLCSFTKTKEVQGVRWWVLVSGARDPNKVFWRYAMSFFLVPFTVWPYLRREFDPLPGLLTVDGGFFNQNDLVSRIKELHFVAFETLVETLESFGIDTSELKQQRASVLNINVTGGQTSFGSVVQGAVGSVRTRFMQGATAGVGGAKA